VTLQLVIFSEVIALLLGMAVGARGGGAAVLVLRLRGHRRGVLHVLHAAVLPWQ